MIHAGMVSTPDAIKSNVMIHAGMVCTPAAIQRIWTHLAMADQHFWRFFIGPEKIAYQCNDGKLVTVPPHPPGGQYDSDKTQVFGNGRRRPRIAPIRKY